MAPPRNATISSLTFHSNGANARFPHLNKNEARERIQTSLIAS